MTADPKVHVLVFEQLVVAAAAAVEVVEEGGGSCGGEGVPTLRREAEPAVT